MKEHYHHGNLKNELIETSICVISEKGFEALSLRGIAAQCGVSHNAVYRHFENKDRLIEACRDFVTGKLTAYLREAIEESQDSPDEALAKLGTAYVGFYEAHPTYYSALYRNSSTRLMFRIEEAKENYPPLELFHRVYFACGAEHGRTGEACLMGLTRFWAALHGLTALVISENVEWNRNWQQCLTDILEQEWK